MRLILNQKLTPGGGLAKFQEQLKGLGQQLGLNGTIVVFVPTANQSAVLRNHPCHNNYHSSSRIKIPTSVLPPHRRLP